MLNKYHAHKVKEYREENGLNETDDLQEHFYQKTREHSGIDSKIEQLEKRNFI